MKAIVRITVVAIALTVSMFIASCYGHNPYSPFNVDRGGYWICPKRYFWFESKEGEYGGSAEGYFYGEIVKFSVQGTVWPNNVLTIDFNEESGDGWFALDCKCEEGKCTGQSRIKKRERSYIPDDEIVEFICVNEEQFKEWKKQWTIDEIYAERNERE